jgi:hypothetical protein
MKNLNSTQEVIKVLGSACAENRATTRKKHGVNSPTGSIFGGPITWTLSIYTYRTTYVDLHLVTKNLSMPTLIGV